MIVGWPRSLTFGAESSGVFPGGNLDFDDTLARILPVGSGIAETFNGKEAIHYSRDP